MSGGDRRDEISWVVLELTRQGEMRADDGTLARALIEALNVDASHPVFIPSTTYVRDGQRITIHLMEGYAFVAAGLSEATYLGLERDCPYVKKVLANGNRNGIPVLQVIEDRDIQDMQRQLQSAVAQDINEGMRVRITQGVYAGLMGDVVDTHGDDAFVHIKLRSFQVIRTVPKVFLEPVGEEDAPT